MYLCIFNLKISRKHEKYNFIAIFAMIAVVMLQGYSVFLQYKEYVSKTFDLINMQFKISVDEEFAGRAHVEYNPHKDGMQRAYYKVMSDEDFKKANPKKSDVFRYEEINRGTSKNLCQIA